MTISKGKAELLRLEDAILKRLVESEVNLLEDVELVNTLAISKETSATVYNSINESESAMKRIND